MGDAKYRDWHTYLPARTCVAGKEKVRGVGSYFVVVVVVLQSFDLV